MSEDGQNILKMIKQNNKLYGQVSLLLQTADEQMEMKGWEAYNSTAMYGMSKILSDPKRWFPNYLFRFYEHDDCENIVVYISILLDDDIYGRYETKLSEPLITAGFFDYGKGKEADEWEYWYAKWYGFHREIDKDDGTIYEAEKNWKTKWEEKLNDKFDFESYKCFGYPLISITSAVEIESKIINKLLELISK